MTDNYEHQNAPLNAHVIRDLLINHLPQDWGWGTIREYVDWSIEHHLSYEGVLPDNYNVYGAVYRVLERFVANGEFEKYKESRTSYYKPIQRNEVEVLLEAMGGVHDNLFGPISIVEYLMTELEALKTELETHKDSLATILKAHNM